MSILKYKIISVNVFQNKQLPFPPFDLSILLVASKLQNVTNLSRLIEDFFYFNLIKNT